MEKVKITLTLTADEFTYLRGALDRSVTADSRNLAGSYGDEDRHGVSFWSERCAIGQSVCSRIDSAGQ